MSDDEKRDDVLDLTRRGFLKSVAGIVGTAAVAGPKHAQADAPQELVEGVEMLPVTLQVNGRNHRLLVEPRWTLLYVLRDQLGFTGTKPGCERGECGSCTVLINGVPRYSCLTLAMEAEHAEITTVEGLMQGENLGAVQQAFAEEDAFQCGYCTPGQVVAVEGLLRKTPHPTIEQVREGMSGNLCRCGTYPHIFKAALRAAQIKNGSGR